MVLTGGWQTDREHAYVALTRARERTDIYLARDDLDTEGLEDGAIARLSARISHSRAQDASITRPEIHWANNRSLTAHIRRDQQRLREQERDTGFDLGF